MDQLYIHLSHLYMNKPCFKYLIEMPKNQLFLGQFLFITIWNAFLLSAILNFRVFSILCRTLYSFLYYSKCPDVSSHTEKEMKKFRNTKAISFGAVSLPI